MTVLALEKHNRFPLSALEAPVNALCFSFHFREQIVITLDVGAAGRSDLHERKFALIGRILLQEPLNREEAFKNSFGVVNTIHTNPHERCLDAQSAQE